MVKSRAFTGIPSDPLSQGAILTIFISCLVAGWANWRINAIKPGSPSFYKIKVSAASATVIGSNPQFRGASSCPYTLVVFLDYECQPCHLQYSRLCEILKNREGKVRLAIRNFPLPIHSHAMYAALVASAAKEVNRFWSVHDALMSKEFLNKPVINRVAFDNSLSASSTKMVISEAAQQNLSDDLLTAKLLGVNGTPTFFLCYPNGDVYVLGSVREVEQEVR